jgi:hypothetical protein
MVSFSSKIDGNLVKVFDYLPYKYSIFFQKPIQFSKRDIQTNNKDSKKIYNLINRTEKKSSLDYTYWELKILYQSANQSTKIDFEKNFINLVLLSKNNEKKKKAFKIYYLRNIPRFSKEVGDIVLVN